ncbi:MAG TPA: hypothetical protein VGD64_06480 [Acidisarcina sp.]
MTFRLCLRLLPALILFPLFAVANCARAADASQHSFKTVVYIPVGTVLKMKDHAWLESSWAAISSQVHVDKVYVETYRSRVIADDALIEDVKMFFADHGVEVAGGVCYSDVDNGQFASFTYTKSADRAYVKHVSELTAKHFNEVILDDFFFANTKTPPDIAAKGLQSWTAFRLKTMDEVSRNLVVGPMKAVNPKIKVIIKFPNWYEHFQGNGYDLENESKIFDGIYAGTETREPVATDQNLQQYEGYGIVRYFEHIDPGKMGGGWVDTYSLNYIDRYSEQLWLTVFAKAREMTLFNYSNLLDVAVTGERPWSAIPGAGIDWKRITARANQAGNGAPTYATVAGDALDQVKPFIDKLGKPIGIASYRPYNGLGEDFLHNFLGMIGIPVDIYPTYPKDSDVVLLTEAAKLDPRIVSNIKASLTAGKTVVITSGLLHALEGKGIEDLVELRYSAAPEPVTGFIGAFGPGSGTMLGQIEKPILFPQIRFLTNDAWPVIRGIADDNAFPILLMDKYSAGTLYVLTVPDNFTDLYRIPEPALNAIRSYIMENFPVQIDAPAKVSLFAYDNHTLIIESFRDEPAEVTVTTDAAYSHLTNLQTSEVLEGTQTDAPRRRRSTLAPSIGPRISFRLTLPAHSYLAFQESK